MLTTRYMPSQCTPDIRCFCIEANIRESCEPSLCKLSLESATSPTYYEESGASYGTRAPQMFRHRKRVALCISHMKGRLNRAHMSVSGPKSTSPLGSADVALIGALKPSSSHLGRLSATTMCMHPMRCSMKSPCLFDGHLKMTS